MENELVIDTTVVVRISTSNEAFCSSSVVQNEED